MTDKKEVRLEHMMPLFRKQLEAGCHIRFAPMGTSMLPMLRQGIDTVEIAPVPARLKKYDLPLYQRENGQYVMHRVIDAGQTYTCMGDNQFDPEPGLRHEQMIAVVVAFYRGEKRQEVSSWQHKLYCRMWHYSRPLRRFWRRGIQYLRRRIKQS